MREFLEKLSRKKPMHVIKAQEQVREEEDSVKLSLFDLLCIGVGCTVGSGVFVLTGDVLLVAGPAATVSWLLAGLVCLLSGFSYMELSSRVPTSGSCYSYSYYGLGECAAYLGGICLTLEYGISAAGVARSWSAKFIATIEHYSDADLSFFHLWYENEDTADTDAYFDIPAGLVMGGSVVVLAFGLKMGKIVINSFTITKVVLVTFMIISGLAAWSTVGYGFDAYSSKDEFLPYGVGGMLLGASKLFFGFIGFDEVACLAGRAQNPRRTMPLAIGGTLLAATVISGLAQFSLSGAVVPCESHPDWNTLHPNGTQCADTPSFEEAFRLVSWDWAAGIVAFGEAILLPIVVLLAFIAQPELFAAMAYDGMLPQVFAKENKEGNLTMGTIYTGIAMTLCAMTVPFDILWDMISLGVLLSFCLTNSSLICVRLSGPEGNYKVMGCLIYLWIVGFASQYMLWKGYLEDYFDDSVDDSTLNDGILYAAIALIVTSLVLLIAMHFIFKEVEESKVDRDRVFFSPLVPLLPGIGINLNFFLMAQISWKNLGYLAIFCVACYIFYFVYSIKHSAREFDDEIRISAVGRRKSCRASEVMAEKVHPVLKSDIDLVSIHSKGDLETADSIVEL
eukprot:CFRG3384T1